MSDFSVAKNLEVSLSRAPATSTPSLWVSVKNTHPSTPVTLLKWDSPLDPLALQLGLVSVTPAGAPAPIDMPTIKVSRGMAPGPGSLVTLRPGESASSVVELRDMFVPKVTWAQGKARLREFFEKDTPPYAILSHRWGEEEILYQDMIPSAVQFVTQNKYGYAKLLGSCSLAHRQGYKWIWIDTCCIDKSSSAELTEAINSMYQWYGAAQVCYAYLNDVKSLDTFTESKWFSRGWTLQELIAPEIVEFYSARWEYLGTKRSLVRPIAAKSGVDVQVLMGGDPLEMSVARRMYWASSRVTTRVEDEAYCLLGLFGVNMPLIYGEGRKAFRRLQEEIIRSSDDQSILAWYATEESDGTPVDFLASRAADFLESGDIAAHPYHETKRPRLRTDNSSARSTRSSIAKSEAFLEPFRSSD
ncbi:hypothetical protein INS49_007220 [Diaporthe citri]|uniref:uncharacterized protein n=1 Tax=Diaporthe citri TaxID=83186 RepID=UPI001C820A94|nr:uncharacterized protein INS49_007220 [Diaporthe citri]KAG6365609.1 hypothetical protein INS49_007220 [Diaporthe citri]